jgi:hypothetical protein
MKNFGKLLLLAIWIPALLSASDFDRMVRAFSQQTGAQQIHIPFFGLARFVVAVAHPAGTSELKLAVFENVNRRASDFMKVTDGFVSGEGWKRIVRVREKNGEATNIYMLPDGNRVRMLVAVLESGEATFVEMRIKPDALMKFVDEHRGKCH